MRNSKRQRLARKRVVRWNNLFVNKHVFYCDTDSIFDDGRPETRAEIQALLGPIKIRMSSPYGVFGKRT